jgi:hypothetical protein
MSRYMINKLLWEVESDEERLASFKRDPAGFVASWELMVATPQPPYPAGGTLTAEERQACIAVDYAALYSMGAHPYLLWHFVRAVLVPDPMTVEELSDALKSAVAPLSRPDFAT